MIRHFFGNLAGLIGTLWRCIDSWENMRRVNVVEEENVVLFMGYNKEEIHQLGVDARNCAVLDSACSNTVCGENWLDSCIQSLDECDRKKARQTVGEKTLNFGGGTSLKVNIIFLQRLLEKR